MPCSLSFAAPLSRSICMLLSSSTYLVRCRRAPAQGRRATNRAPSWCRTMRKKRLKLRPASIQTVKGQEQSMTFCLIRKTPVVAAHTFSSHTFTLTPIAGTTTSSDGASSKHQPVSILPDICTGISLDSLPMSKRSPGFVLQMIQVKILNQ